MKSRKISGVLVYLFALVVVLLLYFYFVFIPLSGKTAELDAAHEQNVTQLHVYEQQIQQEEQLKSKIDEMQAELNSLNPSTAINGQTVAEDIGKACDFAGFLPSDIQVGNETVINEKISSAGQTLCSVPVNLKATCTGTQLLDLLDYFEKQSQGAYYINTVNYTWGPGQFPAEFSLTLYYWNPGEAKK